MSEYLPTGSFATWTVTTFKDSLISTLESDDVPGVTNLYFYFYAVTLRGWSEIRQAVLAWMMFDSHREVSAYVGTDHAITDPEGLEAMRDDGIDVHLMQNYSGVFHPKVVWLKRPNKTHIWAGSNNMTRDGLVNNIEFAITIQCTYIPQDLLRWADEVHHGSVDLTARNLQSYSNQRSQFERERMKNKTTAFTWHERGDPPFQDHPLVQAGALVVEIMPRETGAGGKQIQLPINAARIFFGLVNNVEITLAERGHPESTRQLTMTLFQNHTVRLVISELEYRDRPCVIVFYRIDRYSYEFEIVREAITPKQHRQLLSECCNNQTRLGIQALGNRRRVIGDRY